MTDNTVNQILWYEILKKKKGVYSLCIAYEKCLKVRKLFLYSMYEQYISFSFLVKGWIAYATLSHCQIPYKFDQHACFNYEICDQHAYFNFSFFKCRHSLLSFQHFRIRERAGEANHWFVKLNFLICSENIIIIWGQNKIRHEDGKRYTNHPRKILQHMDSSLKIIYTIWSYSIK